MPRYGFTRVVASLALVTCIGVIGYMVIGGMSFVDALYMTVITLTTVGYEEVQPLDTVGRLFTMLLLVSGLGIVFYGVSVLARDLIEGEIQRAFGRRRMQRQVDSLRDHFIVCGYGRMGRIVCKELAAKPVSFVVVEREGAELEDARNEGFVCIAGDATEDDTLIASGVKKARGLIATLSNDADNVFVVLSAKELNPDLLIVARAENDRGERKLLHAGATRVVSPYVIGGSRMAHALLRPAVLDVLDLATHHRNLELQIEEVTVGTNGFGAGPTLAESGIRGMAGIIVIAIKRPTGEMLFDPAEDVRVEVGDRLVLIGQTSSLRSLESRVAVG